MSLGFVAWLEMTVRWVAAWQESERTQEEKMFGEIGKEN